MAVIGPPLEHNVRLVLTDETEALPYGVGTGGAGRGDRVARPLGVEVHRDIPGGDVPDDLGDGERRHP